MFVWLAVCCLVVLTSAYPDGAPELGCYTSRPMHDTYMPMWEHSPYVLEFKTPNVERIYTAGKPIKLNLRSLKPDQYKLSGYLITMSSSSGLTGGKWKKIAADSKAIPDCGITQTINSTTRTSVDLSYTPPNDLDLETIQFKAIAVHNFSVFWDSVLSPPLTKKDTSVNDFEKMIKEFENMAKLFNFSLGGAADNMTDLAPPTGSSSHTKSPEPKSSNVKTPAPKSPPSRSSSRSGRRKSSRKSKL